MPFKSTVQNRPDIRIDSKRRQTAEKIKLAAENKLTRLQARLEQAETNLEDWRQGEYPDVGSDEEEIEAQEQYFQQRIDYWQDQVNKLNASKLKLTEQLNHALYVIADANHRILLATLEHLPLDPAMIHKNFSGLF